MKFRIIIFSLTVLFSCSEEDDNFTPALDTFFPQGNSEWEKINPADLGWDINGLDNFYSYLESNNTRAFIVLVNGRIAIEQYWGGRITGQGEFDQNSFWYWASAGKTLTATLVGIAQQEGFLNINDKTSDYLGAGWTSLSLEQEERITVRHQLTMTTGLDYSVDDPFCTEPSCLEYLNEPGDVWYYHNAPYTLLDGVISGATGSTLEDYAIEKLTGRIGMDGFWLSQGYNNVFWSTPRDAARFGHLILNEGTWNDEVILQDMAYYEDMITPSQSLNPSYGYLWWLNGQSSIIYPGFAGSFDTSLAPSAPSDLFVAAGKDGQFIDIIPGLNMVVVRMGQAPDNSLVPIEFHDEMWQNFMAIISE